MFFSNKYMADPKAHRLEISEPALRSVVILGAFTGAFYMNT